MTTKTNKIVAMAELIRETRVKLGWSTAELARRGREWAERSGNPLNISQQTISQFEQGRAKRMPSWINDVYDALQEGMNEAFVWSDENEARLAGASVFIERLPTFAGAGGGGTGDDDVEQASFSRALVEYELRAQPSDLLAVEIEGNSMSPDFESGDQLLIDKRKKTIAQPGAFCLWDGDGYVVKYLEKIPDTEPQKIRVISRNTIYSTSERLGEEIQILGRVVWFARRV